ncbi:serine hydrolase [Agromyces sp. ISL-38]|uniref:serine hydrolase domain-containing protein n=1 Tax=Agromyces sp. ISL-38 TaxID=2819107 RepID=UPI001BE73242|nr:serine hydrolase domain-containing protein [Agromyces sp. ISL-38]
MSACTGMFAVSPPTTAPSASVTPVDGSAAACAPNIDEIVARKDTQSDDAMSDDLADRYDAAAAEVFEQVRAFAPAAVVAVRSPEGTWAKAYGAADLAAEVPATTDMYQRVASVAKSFVGTALLQLADEGKVSLDDAIDDYVPNVPNGSHITLRELVTMTSGLPNYSDNPAWWDAFESNPTATWAPQDLLAHAWRMPTSFAPGSDMEYSNTNFVLLGLVIERVTGMPLAEALQTRIIDPLHLDGTTYPSDATMPGPHLNGYTLVPGPSQDTTWVDASEWHPSAAGASGAMISRADDLLTWGRVLATGQGVLSAPVQKERLAALGTTNLGLARFYGQAIMCTDQWIGHDGNISGYNTMLRYNSDTDTTIVVEATGLDGTGTPPRVYVIEEYFSALAAVAGHPFTPKVIPPELQFQSLVPHL